MASYVVSSALRFSLSQAPASFAVVFAIMAATEVCSSPIPVLVSSAVSLAPDRVLVPVSRLLCCADGRLGDGGQSGACTVQAGPAVRCSWRLADCTMAQVQGGEYGKTRLWGAVGWGGFSPLGEQPSPSVEQAACHLVCKEPCKPALLC